MSAARPIEVLTQVGIAHGTLHHPERRATGSFSISMLLLGEALAVLIKSKRGVLGES
jgi:hypothetical protein